MELMMNYCPFDTNKIILIQIKEHSNSYRRILFQVEKSLIRKVNRIEKEFNWPFKLQNRIQ